MTMPFLRSMAVRIFALLAIGMSLAAATGFLISDHDRRQLVQRRYEDQVADRILDVILRLPHRHGPVDRPGPPRDGLPAGVIDIPAPVLGHVIDTDLTNTLKGRLAGTTFGGLSVLKPAAGDCSPLPPIAAPPPPPLAGTPSPPPLPGLTPRLASVPDCRLVTIAKTDAPEHAVMVPVPPQPGGRAEPMDVMLFYVLVGSAVVLAFIVALWATAPLRNLARAATRLGDDLNQPALGLGGPTEVRQAAQAFNLMQARIRKTLEERTFMLAAITHDLQTPLTRQRLRIEQVSDPVLRDQMLDDYRSMRDLIRDGLEVARGGTTRLELQALDLRSMLETICEDAVAAGQNVSLDESVDATVLADPLSLQRCLTNLVDNGVKYGQRVRIAARPVGDRIEVSVSDDGPGIAADKRDAAMQPFVRLDQGDMTLGTGLGLAIARLLAERNGSELTLTNVNGGGLCASIRLQISPLEG